jgi:trimeric autotransporter adhesin
MKKLLPVLLLSGFLTAGAQHFSLIKDINPGSGTSNICYLTDVSNKLFFAANDGVHGMELWKSDGTTTGTTIVKDIYEGNSSSSIGYLTNAGGVLFFVANNGADGTELWKSDGTIAGTVLVKDIRAGSMGSDPSALVNINGVLFFSADDGIRGMELWKSDGTIAGTVLVKDINPNSGSSYPQAFATVNNTLFFAADNGIKGTELWKSDGTAAGTVLVKDIWQGNSDSYPVNLTGIGNNLFFSANDGNSGTELWKSDGTATGTVQVKDIWSGASDGYPFGLVNVNGVLFFSADNGANGIELWKSDGSSSGTTLVKDVWPGEESGAVGNFSRFINKLIFKGNDGVSGYKTWQSDGTATGTKVASGLADTGDDDMGELVETGTKVFAAIRQDETGNELWGSNNSVILPLTFLDFRTNLVKNDAILSWKTESELNTSAFIIERSSDGNRFEEIGRVAAVNNGGINNYTFTDAGITSYQKNTFYYRLKQTDIDSRFSYSKIISIAVKRTGDIALYPNPATNEINVVTSVLNGPVRYSLFDNSGKLVLQSKESSDRTNHLSIDISKLSAGIYHLALISTDLTKQVQFVKR